LNWPAFLAELIGNQTPGNQRTGSALDLDIEIDQAAPAPQDASGGFYVFALCRREI
jgi:hypothetical protein